MSLSAASGLRPETWDLVVLGGGTAGIVGAKTAAALGARVLLVERERTGGECLLTGCVPSKALLAVADRAAAARSGAAYGVRVGGPVEVDFAAVMAHVRAAIEAIAPEDSAETLEAAGVVVRHGTGLFSGPDRMVVDGVEIGFAQALVATGSRPRVPDLPGLAGATYLTNETVWDLAELPADLVVLGAGPMGCELSQAFARLGSRVTLLESADRVLPGEDPRASEVLTQALRADGVTVRTGATAGVERVEADTLALAGGDRIAYSHLLLAVGREPTTADLGLEAAGVELEPDGSVRLDAQLTTTNPRIRAAGDLTGHPRLTHLAGVHASLAVSNALLGLTRSVEADPPPRVVFTDPEVAAVGAPTADGERPSGSRLLERDHAHLDRAIAEGRTEGFTRLVLDRRRRIVGATVVGPRAGETLGEIALAIAQGLTTSDLAGLTHAYPTYDDAVWNLAVDDAQTRLDSPAARFGVRLLTWWRGRRLSRRGQARSR